MILPPDPSNRHRCQPPKYMPRDDWLTLHRADGGPDRAYPTQYPEGSLWVCQCDTWWINDVHDGCAPPTYLWRRVRWWNFTLRRAIRQHRDHVHVRLRALGPGVHKRLR